MPNSIITPPFSSNSSQVEYDGSEIHRPVLCLQGTRTKSTSEVTLTCRLHGVQFYTHPVIALFVCRDHYSERDRFTYLGQSSPTVLHVADELECKFVIQDCPEPILKEREEEDYSSLTPRSLADRLANPPPEKPSGPTTQLKLNIYATNTSSVALGDGTLQANDILGTAYVDLERLLEHKEDDNGDRGVSVELTRPTHANLSHPSIHSTAHSSFFSGSSGASSSPDYTTMLIPHQIPSASAIASSPQTLGMYGVKDQSIKSVLTTPTIIEPSLDQQHEEFLRKTQHELARAEKRNAKPIEHPRGRYELEPTNSQSLAEHQQNKRMCSTEEGGCIIC